MDGDQHDDVRHEEFEGVPTVGMIRNECDQWVPTPNDRLYVIYRRRQLSPSEGTPRTHLRFVGNRAGLDAPLGIAGRN